MENNELQVVSVSVFIALDHWREGSTTRRILVALNVTLPSVYPTTTLVLFGISSYITSNIFYSLKQDLKTINISSAQLRSWKHRHILATQLVNCLNNCFGWTLLISTCYLLLAIINSSFYFFGDLDSDPLEIVFAMMNIFHLSIMTFSSDNIRKQVRSFLIHKSI